MPAQLKQGSGYSASALSILHKAAASASSILSGRAKAQKASSMPAQLRSFSVASPGSQLGYPWYHEFLSSGSPPSSLPQQKPADSLPLPVTPIKNIAERYHSEEPVTAPVAPVAAESSSLPQPTVQPIRNTLSGASAASAPRQVVQPNVEPYFQLAFTRGALSSQQPVEPAVRTSKPEVTLTGQDAPARFHDPPAAAATARIAPPSTMQTAVDRSSAVSSPAVHASPPASLIPVFQTPQARMLRHQFAADSNAQPVNMPAAPLLSWHRYF